MFEGMMAEPPGWLRWVHSIGWWLTAVILAVVFMVQWAFCMAIGMHFLGTPGLILGIALVAAQICALFLTPDPKNSCSI